MVQATKAEHFLRLAIEFEEDEVLNTIAFEVVSHETVVKEDISRISAIW